MQLDLYVKTPLDKLQIPSQVKSEDPLSISVKIPLA